MQEVPTTMIQNGKDLLEPPIYWVEGVRREKPLERFKKVPIINRARYHDKTWMRAFLLAVKSGNAYPIICFEKESKDNASDTNREQAVSLDRGNNAGKVLDKISALRLRMVLRLMETWHFYFGKTHRETYLYVKNSLLSRSVQYFTAMIKRWNAWLCFVSILIPSVAMAQVNQTQLKGITVRIDVEGSNKEAGGSGVIVRQQGQFYTILTAYHVVQEKRSYKVLIFNPLNMHIIGSHIINENDIKQIADYDLAEITIKSSAKYITANIGDGQRLNLTEDLYVSGYPLPSYAIPTRLSTPSNLLGQFTDRLNPDALPRGKKGATLKIDIAIDPGMSGGAVVDTYGELVGILSIADKDASGHISSSLVTPINLFPQWQAIRNSQRSSSQSTSKPMTNPDNPYPDPECSSLWDPFQGLRYKPQKSVNIAYQADKKYVNVDFDQLMNRSEMGWYNNKLVSFKASFAGISNDFGIYGQLGQISQAERSRHILASILSLRTVSGAGILIDKEKFDDILKIRGHSIVKIDGYATVRDAFFRVDSSKYVLAENQEQLLIEVHQIQVICQFDENL